MTKDQEIAALKAQVNALRQVVFNLLDSDSKQANKALIHYRFVNPLNKTPQQCLAEYNEALINSMLVTCGDCNTLDFRDVWTIPDEKVDAFIEELKND